MFRTYFGDLRTGRLARLPFLGYLLLLTVLFTLFGMGIAFGISALNPLTAIFAVSSKLNWMARTYSFEPMSLNICSNFL